jgi:hypothetical protein
LLVIIIVLLIGGGSAAAAVFISKSNAAESSENSGGSSTPVLSYAEGVVALDEDTLQSQVDAMMKQAEEGTMTLEFKNTAYSSDGINFTCSVGNAIENKYDMYINIYTDDTLEDEILLTGLIPPGTGIESFESEIQLDPGDYETVMVLTQVSDDHTAIVGQLSVVLNLVVSE